jgi:hypothetical protein
MSDRIDDFSSPGGSFDDFLAEEFAAQELSTDDEEQSTDGKPTDDPIVSQLDEDAELTMYGAMLVAVTAATDALADQDLTAQADGFRAYLADLRTELYR